MTIEEIEEKVIQIVSDIVGVPPDSLNRETSFNDLNADSLDTVEVVMEFEEIFMIEITDDDADKLLTLGQCIDHIKELVS
jgi:acyl carrier protein